MECCTTLRPYCPRICTHSGDLDGARFPPSTVYAVANVGLMKIPIDKKLEVDMGNWSFNGGSMEVIGRLFQYNGPRLIV